MSEPTRAGGGILVENITYETWLYDADMVDQKIASAITGGYKVKGTKTVSQLNTLAPTVGTADASLKPGDVYNLSDGGTLASAATNADSTVVAGDNVVWTEDGWDRLTGMVDLSGKQDKITASGLLKGNGSGGVAAATPGTDYVKSVAQATDAVVTVTGSGGELTVDHAKKGPSSSGNTSKGDTTDQTPAFGGTFKAVSATVDKYGHVTALAEHTVTIPSLPSASTSAAGIVQLSDSTSDTSTTKAATANAVKTVATAAASAGTAAATEKTKRNAVAMALSTYSALTASSSQGDTRTLVNALLAALKAFGADA